MALALMSALMHAIFGALQKGRHDPWLSRGAIDLCILLIALPVGLWAVPHPQGGRVADFDRCGRNSADL